MKPNTAGDAGPTFEVASQVDLTKLPLTAEEGFVVSRMLGRRVGLTDLATEAALSPTRTREILDSLVGKGAVVRVGATPPAAGGAYDGVIFSAADMAEPADLTEEQRKKILLYDMKLESWSYYKLLGAKRTGAAADVKAAYFKASKEFHPDAFFRKRLGSYQERIDRIFKAMKVAYDTLTDPARRASYDATATIELSPEEEAELRRRAELKREQDAAADREARTEQLLRDKRMKRNPMVERIKRGKDLLALAEEALAANKLEDAAMHARLAMTFDEATRIRAQEVLLGADRKRAMHLIKRVQQVLASPNDWRTLQDELNKAADQVSETAEITADAGLLVDCARVMLSLRRPARAGKLASRATEADAKNPRAWEALAEAAHTEQKWAMLHRACERWIALEPQAARPKELEKIAKRHT